MFLKSLTLKGFKSFAEKTSLDFEPGVTVVVGPNGSGKSNLVDAVAWVLGAQGPRTVRGGKMEDVIFAGTPQRPALGRAEVSLTIDNSAGALPIEFAEVTITRTLFRSGDSEYAINDVPCRLLDIQELLSDTGIGRQQHVIVGQGQLDTILNATPEERRAIVEEAAGILKFRKRKERAERRLVATEANLLRLNDLLREVRRQLTPLERQAARRGEARQRGRRAARDPAPPRRSPDRGPPVAPRAPSRRARRARRPATASCAPVWASSTKACSSPNVRSPSLGDEGVAEWLVRIESLRERARGHVGAARREASRRGASARGGGRRRRGRDVGRGRGRAPQRARRRSTRESDVRTLPGHRRAARGRHRRGRARSPPRSAGAAPKHRPPRLAPTPTRSSSSCAPRAPRPRSPELEAVDGVVGTVIDHLEIDSGAETAVAAALGDAMRAVVVRDADAARAARSSVCEQVTRTLW